ncbi:cell division protein FtsI [Longimycelium tulufanense]|uniref:Cell division protein FtsI n=1 Tax=Longimycelium tulufanense TaxID=907463 RepID=A0A8J3C676_9PSEU|nr:penicillin-binding protein 2 [Longimycelium tulufanense]GGM37903.1 cell division protein FtsI [Longimycelium tulufanense]
MSRASRPVPRRRPVRGVRTRRAESSQLGDHRNRLVVGRALLVLTLVLAGLKLVQVQALDASELTKMAEKQRLTSKTIPARRGAIIDREGRPLAISMEVKSLAARPQALAKEWNKPEIVEQYGIDAEGYTAKIAKFMHEELGDSYPEEELLKKLRRDVPFVYLADNVPPDKARKITKRFPAINAEDRELRQYPAGDVAGNILGFANWRMNSQKTEGLFGLENYEDTVLAGKQGRRIVETAEGNNELVIPDTERDVLPATPGSSLELTIDSDVQFKVQQLLSDHVRRAKARSGNAVVLDAHTGEVYALANDKTLDPSKPLNRLDSNDPRLRNPAVTDPFEPGSVNKIITAAAAIEDGLVKPDTVVEVPGSIQVSDRTIRDAWSHGTEQMTFTGVLARSSNVGTIKTAQQVGEERFVQLLQRFGIGQLTKVGLPGESAGQVPPRSQWSGSTFGNLPIGQGLSMTVLQMAGMYQAIANDGVRVPPRILRAVTGPDGKRQPEPRPEGVRVVSPDTARTVRGMLRAVVQDSPDPLQRGTSPKAALEGYQIAGKTGTALQVDPRCRCYVNDKQWITFAGILPADNPRFVVGLMIDRPEPGNPVGVNAGPLFREIASYLVQRYQIPTSPDAAPVQQLTLR